MSTTVSAVITSATVIDLPGLSVNFPPVPKPELMRDNVVNTLANLLSDGVYAACVEGADGIGKTTILSQFARRFCSAAISVFVSATNRLSFDTDLIRSDLATQIYWILTGDILQRDSYDPLLLKSYYGDLQRRAKHTKSLIFFVIDGIEELDRNTRDQLLQQLADTLPIGIPQFRFLFSGDESLYKPLIGNNLVIKSYPLTEFSAEEAKAILAGYDLSTQEASDVNSICRGMPGRLASVRRALDSGVHAHDFVRDAPTKWPEFFDIDWRQIDESDQTLLKILALLVHDLKPHTVSDIAGLFNLSEAEVASRIQSVLFLHLDPGSGAVRFANSGLVRYVAERLKDRKLQIQKILIKRLLAVPHSTESLLELPTKLEEASQYPDLLELLTPDHILQVLERTQTLSTVDDTVQRGFRSAKKLGRDADILRFSLQQSIVAEIASANARESEISALVALRHDNEALALANSAMLREDRLLMLTALAHGVWLRGDPLSAELLDNIRLLIENLDYWSLGRRAGAIASKLTCVNPDLATAVLTKAKWATDESDLDRAFVSLTVSALRDIKDERRREQAMEIAARSRRDGQARGFLEGVRVLSGRVAPRDVCGRVKEIEGADARLLLLRYWCVLNGAEKDADEVAQEAVRIALASPEAKLDAALFADLSRALSGAPTAERKRELIGVLDGLRATAERLGPSVDYVKLQLSLASQEAAIDAAACEGRLIEVLDYIARIGDLPSRGEAYASFLGAVKKIKSGVELALGDGLVRSCASELEGVVLVLSESTADHELSLGGVITGLAGGDVDRALDYTRVVNTELRRNAVLRDVVDVLLRRPTSEIKPGDLQKVLGSMTGNDERDEALLSIMERFASADALPGTQVGELLPIISSVEAISDSVIACRSIVSAIKILATCSSTADYGSLQDHLSRRLMSRWESIDVGWLKIDAGFGIATDLAAIDVQRAEAMLDATEVVRAESQVSAPQSASTFVACIHLVARAFCGLLHRRLENDADLRAMAALIDVIPAHGERAVLWADVCMRAAIAGRTDLTEQLVKKYLLPAFSHVPHVDASYRAGVLIQIAPALHRAQPTRCHEELSKLNADDRDVALREIIRFLLSNRVPSDPVEGSARTAAEISYETLLQVEVLTKQLDTDWMIYSTAEDIADLLQSPINRLSLTAPQREDIARRFAAIAKDKLPVARQISHPGFRIATLAQTLRFTQSRQSDWTDLIEQAKTLSNVADRVYVLQIVALALPKSMSAQSSKLLEIAKQQIVDIPCALDQIERYVGMAEDLYGLDSQMCRELVSRAATAIADTSDDVRDQRRRLIDVAYRIDVDFARTLIEAFDDDDAKRRAQAQMRLLEVRNSIKENQGTLDQDKILRQVRSDDVSRLGALLLRSLNAGRVQNYHPSEIRSYLDLAAEQPLKKAYSLLVWYVENAVARFAKTDHAATFLRPIFDACVVGAQLAGQVAGRAMIRLKAVKAQSAQLSSGRSVIATPGSRDEAVQILSEWFERHLREDVLVHDPYFNTEDLQWLQVIRSARPGCRITVMTARKNQPVPPAGEELEDVYAVAWRAAYDQQPPNAEIAIIGGELSKDSPIHDRWLVSGDSGLRFGTSLNSLGITKHSEISEMTAEDAEQKRMEMMKYLTRETSEHRGEKLRLKRFWL
jgi:hypothetical protein